MKVVIDDCRLERMDVYTDPLNDKIKRQAADITRLLAENAELKKDLEYYHTGTDTCDIESARATGQDEAWELAKKIGEMYAKDAVTGSNDIYECFHTRNEWHIMMHHYTYREAAIKVAEWEQKKEEICVGDVLLSNSIREKCVVTANCNGIFTLLWKYGSSGTHGEKVVRKYEKVGHIDVDAWLARIGDER